MQKISNYIKIIDLAFRAELRTVLRNKGALLILIGAIIIYPLIYSISYSPELLRELPIAVVDMDNTSTSRTLIKMVDATEQINLNSHVSTLHEAENKFASKEVYGVLLIPKDFESDILHGGQTSISTYCDASYMLIYKQTLSGIIQSSLTFSAGVEIKRLMAKGNSMEQSISQAQPIRVKFNDLYNPASAYGSYVMPAIIIFILQQTLLIGIGLIGGSQREKGNHIHTVKGFYKHPSAIILGKTLTYSLITFFNAIFALGLVHHWFQFPTTGDLITVILFLIPFVLSTVFLGISISALFKKAEHSIMILVFLSLILMFLSGFSWPVELFPAPLKIIRLLFPSSIIIQPYLRIREMGASLANVKIAYIMITVQMVVYFFLTLFIFKQKRRNAIRKSKKTSLNNEESTL